MHASLPIVFAIPGKVRAFIEEVHAFVTEVCAWKGRIGIKSVNVYTKISKNVGVLRQCQQGLSFCYQP